LVNRKPGNDLTGGVALPMFRRPAAGKNIQSRQKYLGISRIG
jgi:hypothetical protein